ncbi:non-canonical purine NTP pyrophosphatase [Noviherbaspirillum suwonense]|uniref:XTP/dITP diphosphohydrolase n=1 Tax=Noviherbaspirillum suwonense TaxID=1224511 RepID=A0ABY1PZ69_9BURK|nr:non-canonical purine NTP pyrophosphatase [Noviherbaspirillum suwonense]SMP52294.1 XTP/dITP diphosphohydrolase [Noviherbaspirillum suwonense]
MFEIRFLSGNKFKIEEASTILKRVSVSVIPINEKIEELQTADTHNLVKDKALKAFQLIGRPLFVEHTGLYLSHMNGLPGGLTQIFWDTLQAERFTQLFGSAADNSVIAKTLIGFVDGRKFEFFEGSIKGSVPVAPRGNRDFQWDCVFVPDGYAQTFAEMGDQKNEISMRRRALDQFSEYLENRGKV